MSQPLVSIYLPTFNYGTFLKESLESIRNQSYQNFELFLINNNSTDDTYEIIKEYIPLFGKKLIYKHNTVNSGAEPSINKYLDESKGHLIAFQAGDDIWLPNKLQQQIELFMTKPTVGLVYSNFFWWDTRRLNKSSIRIAHNKEMPEGNILPNLLNKNFIGATTVAVRRKALFDIGGFDQKFDLMGDYAAWLRICRKYSVAYISTPLVKIRIHGGNLSCRKLLKMRAQEASFIRIFVFTFCKNEISLQKKIAFYLKALSRILSGYLRLLYNRLTS